MRIAIAKTSADTEPVCFGSNMLNASSGEIWPAMLVAEGCDVRACAGRWRASSPCGGWVPLKRGPLRALCQRGRAAAGGGGRAGAASCRPRVFQRTYIRLRRIRTTRTRPHAYAHISVCAPYPRIISYFRNLVIRDHQAPRGGGVTRPTEILRRCVMMRTLGNNVNNTWDFIYLL